MNIEISQDILIKKLEKQLNRLPTEQEIANSKTDRNLLLEIVFDKLTELETRPKNLNV